MENSGDVSKILRDVLRCFVLEDRGIRTICWPLRKATSARRTGQKLLYSKRKQKPHRLKKGLSHPLASKHLSTLNNFGLVNLGDLRGTSSAPQILPKPLTRVAKGSQEVKSPSHARGRYISGPTPFLQIRSSGKASKLGTSTD